MAKSEEGKKGKKLELSRPGKLELKKTVETGQVRQKFSHGRSRMVTVEVRKKRTFAPNAGGQMAEVPDENMEVEVQPEPVVVVELVTEPTSEPIQAGTLTEEEKASRARALEGAKQNEEKVSKDAALDKSSEEVERQRELDRKAVISGAAAKLEALEEGEADPDQKSRSKRTQDRVPLRPPPSRRTEPRRRSGKLTIAEALGGSEERTRSLASIKRAREKEKQQQQQHLSEGKKIIRDVVVPETITVQELANRMAERATDVIKALMKLGVMVTITQTIDADTAELVVNEFGHNLRRVSAADVELGLKGEDDNKSFLVSRPPVVTVMGHVDHGKTSLLDAIRETDIASHEKGGITQHIGAYQVTLATGQKISFIDTPGHAAFTEMRARGANVTDIVVLCVAADDGVMPQTIEAISHAKAAKVPIIVAINKIDKEGADAKRICNDLLQHDLVVEEMGGDILVVEVSAKEKTNIDKLEEAILLQAELLDCGANPNRLAEGAVIEAKLEQGRGPVATVLVQRGTLSVGDIFVAGNEWGRVRALIDSYGSNLEFAGPSMPVEVLGLNGTPGAGEEFAVVESEGRAREVVEFRQDRVQNEKAAAGARGTLEQMFENIQEKSNLQLLPVVIKGDVQGSIEAINSALKALGTEEVQVKILHSGVGGINESDITLAKASGASVIGFNVRPNPQARDMAVNENIKINEYSLIYDLIDELKKVLSGLLSPTIKESLLGNAEIREIFNVSKVGKIAGCIVTKGLVRRGARVRLVRGEEVIHEGEMSQLKHFKDDVKEVKDTKECGMGFADYQDIQVGDLVECFETEEIAREL